jgi:hypothetical protein
MTDLRARLREALDDEEDAQLSRDDAAAIRRVVVAAAHGHERQPERMWIRPLAVAATVVVMVAAGIAIGERFDARPAHGADRNLPAHASPDRARQLHFSTPGGTRIIWIFNSDLDLKTTP